MVTSPSVRASVGILAVAVGLDLASDTWLTGYGVLAITAWMALIVSFLMTHAPEKTMTEIIRESR